MKQGTIVLALLLLSGCQTPFLLFSGRELQGPVVSARSFDFAAEHRLLILEVRPRDPYSVILRVVMRDGELYVDAAESRRWHTHLKDDPRVRVKLGDTIYPAVVVKIDNPDSIGGFIKGRTIYRLVPR